MILAFVTRHWQPLAGALAALLAVAFIWTHLAADARLRGKYRALTAQAGQVVIALRDASDNPRVKWDTAPGQIVALGESVKALRASVEVQNERIDAMAADAVRARAAAAELKRIADRAQAQRASALRRLSDMSVTPGTRADCMTLLREAETALDLVREAGA